MDLELYKVIGDVLPYVCIPPIIIGSIAYSIYRETKIRHAKGVSGNPAGKEAYSGTHLINKECNDDEMAALKEEQSGEGFEDPLKSIDDVFR